MVIGSTCQPCNCNGNSDPNMLFSDCHPLTGECQSCMHNSAGPHCEICAPGFYGDAITAKNCTRKTHLKKKKSNLDGISCFQRALMIALFPTCITQDATVLLVALNVVTLTQGSATVSLVWWEPTVTTVRYVCSYVLSLSIVSSRRLMIINFF